MLALILVLVRVSAFDLRLARRATTRQLTCLAAPRYTSTLAPLRHRLAGRSGYPLACPPATSRPHPSAASDKRSPLDSSALNAPAQSSPYPRSRGRLWLNGGSARGSYSHGSVRLAASAPAPDPAAANRRKSGTATAFALSIQPMARNNTS